MTARAVGARQGAASPRLSGSRTCTSSVGNLAVALEGGRHKREPREPDSRVDDGLMRRLPGMTTIGVGGHVPPCRDGNRPPGHAN